MFNSRNPIYRNPLGAVKCNENIHLKINLPRDLACTGAYLLMERDGEKIQCFDMFWCGMNGSDHEWWECDYKPSEIGLYFYHFELKTSHGRSQLFKGSSGSAVTEGSSRWQITVYAEDFTTPDWLAGGIMYQIFPDRFYSSQKNKLEIPSYREIHKSWDEMPRWTPNENGIITNEDFFGGDLRGIEEKLPYLKELGVTCIYTTPIFRSRSNHHYDTGNYEEIDPSLGTEADFISLCSAAKKLGIHVILDGVFSHTGSDSIYFNKERHYDSIGAYNSKESDYYSWYHFTDWPEKYDCWWGFTTLPNVNENNESFTEYINGETGIVGKWIRNGADGWRLDVADELPDEFLDSLRNSAKSHNPDSLILGEVWEDASTKTAYGERRRYLLGKQLDTVMNYPFRAAILGYIIHGKSSRFFETIETILENYPPQCIRLLMNHIGTHDTERAITMLAGEALDNRDRAWQSSHSLTEIQYELGTKRMKLASLIQFMLPGVPCIYYGDEAGVEGYRDPFNRKTYPWGKENTNLLSWYKQLGKLRSNQPILAEGAFRRVLQDGDLIVFERYMNCDAYEDIFCIIANRGNKAFTIPESVLPVQAEHLQGYKFTEDTLIIPPVDCSVYCYRKQLDKPEK